MPKKKNIQESLFHVAEIGITYRPKIKAADRPKIIGSSTACKILWQQWDKNTIELVEQFKVIFLNWGGRVLGIYEHAAGNMHATLVDHKLIIAAALKARANSIILAHNHPSGNLNPSDADLELTRKIKRMAKIFDLRLFDHIILTSDGYFSFADEGVL
jgi:DNA repair protein RadC